jgi:YgiT-type zinc finger domain-containing protein
MEKSDFMLKKDKYKSARGGHSKLLNLYCRKCNSIVAVYQKDGPGSLLRLYFDRILSPTELVGLQVKNIKDVPALKCKNCGEIIASPYIYPPEKRKAFRLYHDAVIKRLLKRQ